MGGKSKSAKFPKYKMSILMGICAGPVDEINRVYVGEKVIYDRLEDTQYGRIDVDKEGLFGGIQKEGGVSGQIDVLDGSLYGTPRTDELAKRVGLPKEEVPGFRGILSLFFRGKEGGFYWGANNPYLKPVWVAVERFPSYNYLGPGRIIQASAFNYDEDGNPVGYGGELRADANPASIIVDCMLDTDWGLGWSDVGFDAVSFSRFAQACSKWGLGLSMVWTRSSSTQAFIDEILACVDAVMFTNPSTGLMDIRWWEPSSLEDLSDDSGDADLQVYELNPDNATLSSFSRKAWGETVNEMKVTWTNPETEKEESVYVQDDANIAMQGAVISDSRNYYGVRYRELAVALAHRELTKASLPLCSCEAVVDRSMWDIVPMSTVRLTWPEYGVYDLQMRVVKVSYGQTGNSQIRLSLIEDYSAYMIPELVTAEGQRKRGAGLRTSWESPAVAPVAATRGRALPVPAYGLMQSGMRLEDHPFPSALMAPVVVSPYGRQGVAGYHPFVQTTTPTGAQEWTQAGDRWQFASAGVIPDALPRAVGSVISQLTDLTGPEPRVNDLLVIGPDSAAADELELALVQGTHTGGLTIQRGALDTVPQDWPAGTPCWVIRGADFDVLDVDFTEGQTGVFRAATATSLGDLDLAQAPQFYGIAASRHTLPLRPARLRVNGEMFSAQVLSTDTYISVSWNTRNRLLEDSIILPWDAASVPPEDGATVSVVVESLAGQELYRADGLTDTSVTIYPGDFQIEDQFRIRVLSVRDGAESWQSPYVDMEYVDLG